MRVNERERVRGRGRERIFAVRLQSSYILHTKVTLHMGYYTVQYTHTYNVQSCYYFPIYMYMCTMFMSLYAIYNAHVHVYSTDLIQYV